MKPIGIVILAGGRSSRMGRDKATLRLGARTMLSTIRRSAEVTGWAVRVIRRDSLPGHGPLGGVHEALRTSRAEAELLLACDMPFITAELLKRVVAAMGSRRNAVFSSDEGVAGFPLVVRVSMLPLVERQIAAGRLSLQDLARVLGARLLPVRARDRHQLLNINTPAEWRQVLQSSTTYQSK